MTMVSELKNPFDIPINPKDGAKSQIYWFLKELGRKYYFLFY